MKIWISIFVGVILIVGCLFILSGCSNLFGGEAITLTLVMTYVAVAFVTIAIWKLYTSKKGKFSFRPRWDG